MITLVWSLGLFLIGLFLIILAILYWRLIIPLKRVQDVVSSLQSTHSTAQSELTASYKETQEALTRLHAIQEQSNIALTRSQSTMDTLKGFSEAAHATLLKVEEGTTALHHAFRTPQQQGSWGELVLQQVVEQAGLKEHLHYALQFAVPDKSKRNGASKKLDMVMYLPNQRSIILDVKNPSEVYLEIANGNDVRTTQEKTKRYLEALKRAIRELAQKEYWSLLESSPPLVILFLPMEAMFRTAVEADPHVLEEAVQQQILLASPMTVMALIYTISYGWSQHQRAQNTQQLIQQSKKLYKELKTMNDEWQNYRKQLLNTVAAYNQLTAAYTNRIIPVIQTIQSLDDTLRIQEQITPPLPLHESLQEPQREDFPDGNFPEC